MRHLKMFLNIEKPDRKKTAIKDDSGYSLTYEELCHTVEELASLNIPRSIVFCLCSNCAGSLAGYLAFENNGQVPLLLSSKLDESLRLNLEQIYQPGYYWIPEQKAEEIKRGQTEGEQVYAAYGYVLLKTAYKPYPLHESLSMLLTTSGSTGSPKLVRHKYGNLEANAENAAKAFSWTGDEIGICDLPMNYTMGLNVINSHLFAGATVLMVNANLMDPDFWKFMSDMEIYVDSLAEMQIRNLNSFVTPMRSKIRMRDQIPDSEHYLRTLKVCEIDEDDYFPAHVCLSLIRSWP